MRILAIIEKEIIHILRDIRMLYFSLIWPVFLLLLFGYTVSLDVKNIKILFRDFDQTSESRGLAEMIENTESFDLVRDELFAWETSARLLDQGIARGIVIIPKGFSKKLMRDENAKFQILIDGSDNNTARAMLGSMLGATQSYHEAIIKEELNRLGINSESPIDYHMYFFYNPSLRSQNFIIPGLIAIIMMIIGTLVTSLTIAREWDRGTMEQLLYTPVKSYELILGKLTPYFGIGLIQVTLVLLTGVIIFGVPFKGNILLYYLASALFLLGALGLGLFISLVSRNQQVAMIAAFLSSMLPAFILSGFIFPIRSMPIILRIVSDVVPAKYFLYIIRGVFLKGAGLNFLWPDFLAMLIFASVFLLISVTMFKKRL